MRPFTGYIPGAILLLFLGAPLCAQSQASKDHSPAQSGIASTYPPSEDGLKSFLLDMLDAVREESAEKTSSYFSSLTIPDHSAWFTKTFGPDEGARLESKYTELLPRLSGKLNQRFSNALDRQLNTVTVSVLRKPMDQSARFDRAIFEAMVQPVPIYRANGIGPIYSSGSAGPMTRFPIYLGDYVFVDGAFRYIDSEVFEALSTAPQPRIRQGEKVTAASIVRQDVPHYPEEARREHIQGNVVLHVIVGTNGAVKNIELVSGDPGLTDAAIEAVKQWKYKPTLLDGKPVEVDTLITVTFRLNE
jgi:TonB family protein